MLPRLKSSARPTTRRQSNPSLCMRLWIAEYRRWYSFSEIVIALKNILRQARQCGCHPFSRVLPDMVHVADHRERCHITFAAHHGVNSVDFARQDCPFHVVFFGWPTGDV